MPKLNPIDQDHLRQTLGSKGWAMILDRLDQAIATTVRDAIDAEGDAHLKAKGKYEGLSLAKAIPETLLAETGPAEGG